MNRRVGAAKQAAAILALVMMVLIVMLVAPPAVRIAIALIALPLSMLVAAAMTGGNGERKLPQA
jgi:hypothetical protein